MKAIRCLALALMALFSASPLSARGNAEGPRIVLKAAEDHELTYPTTQALVRMGELLEKWTRGRISIVVYPLAQLGAETQSIEATRRGEIEINRVNINLIANIVPEFKAFALPYIFRDDAHMHSVVDGEIGRELMRHLEPKGLVGLGFYDSGARSFYNSRRPVRAPSDLRGLRIRVQPAELMMDMMSALGAIPIPMDFEDVYTGLQTGLVDGAENNYPSWVTKGHFETARYYTQDEHSRVPEIILFSKVVWDRLSTMDQEIIRKAAQDSIPYQRTLWDSIVAESVRAAEAAGCAIITDVDRQAFIDAMKPVYTKHSAGLQPLIDRIRAVE